MTTRRTVGRWAVFYHADKYSDPVAVTYHRRVGKRLRQMTISPKLLKKTFTEEAYRDYRCCTARDDQHQAAERASTSPG